jgi:lysophospholipase L1-like esterase
MTDVIPTPCKVTSLFKQGIFILLPIVLFFGVAETVARVHECWVPPLPVDIGQGFDRNSLLFLPTGDGYMETNPDKVVSFQRQRFMSPKPPRTLRIFALGGSSVNYLDYEFSRMQQELQVTLSDQFDMVEIINCGGLSYGTHRLVLIASEIVHYEPDLVMIYSGHNEFEELEQLHLSDLTFTTTQKTLGKSALFRFLRDIAARRRITSLEEAKAVRDLATSIPDSSKTWLHEFSPEEIQERVKTYESNLASIITLFRSRHIPVVIGTVPSNLIRPNLPGKDGVLYEEVVGLFSQGRYEEGAKRGRELLRKASPRHQSSDAENEVIRKLAAEYEIPLADVEKAVIAAEPHGVPGETLFNDHCHLNPAGNKILRTLYQEKILEIVSPGGALDRRDRLQ